MNNRGGGGGSGGVGGGPSLSRRRNHQQKNKGVEMERVLEDPNGGPSDEQQPMSTGSFHRQIAASLMRHHGSVNRNGRALQPVSPASYSSSMEVTPYNAALTPSSSVEFTGRIGDSSYSLKTSTELLKVLNRIWSLEEQHASHLSLINAFKTELDNARMRIKGLLQEKQMDRHVIDDLMKQVAEDKHVKKKIEQDRLKSTLQPLKEELEDERKLRKRSESLQRKLARQISDMKSSFSKAVNEIENEKRARALLEDLCDEFAIGIRAYEQKLRSLKYKNEKDRVCGYGFESLVLQMSEAWLDERMQMRLFDEGQSEDTEKRMVVEKLRPEIEAFLKARLELDSRPNVDANHVKDDALESFHLNEAMSAPRNPDDDDNDEQESIDSDSNCFELNNNVGVKQADNPEVKAHEDVVKVKQKVESRDPVVIGSSQRSRNQEERRNKRFGNRGVSSSHHVIDNLLRNNSSSLDGERVHPESSLADDSLSRFILTGPASPVKKWGSKIELQGSEISEFPKKWKRGSKESSLKDKLLEARLEGQYSQSKASKCSQ